MKKFKGGLYADLGNYKTSLPNTEILNNFFASNPVGYRSGGIVRGVAGGNPTGMKVTGGFLNRAQRYAPGGAVSAYYSPSNVGVRPGNFRAAGKQYRSDLFDKIFELRESNPRNFGFASDDPKGHEAIAKALGVSVLDVKRSLAENTPNSGIRIAPMDRVEQYDKEGKVKGDPVLSTLEQSEKQYPEGTKLPTYPPNIPSKEETEKIEKEKTERIKNQYTGGEGSSRMGDDGITGISLEELKKQKKEAKKKKKYQNVNEFLDTDKESTSSVTSELDSMKKNNVSTVSTDPAYPDAPTIEDVDSDPNKIFNDLMEKGGIQEIIEGNKKANAEDIKNINAIGKGYYGKDKDKDAPAWAMPLMMAGLQMAASDNPDMLGALGEGGIAGLKEYARGQKEKREDAKDKIELDLKKVDAIQKIKGRDIDIATLQTNMFSTATSVAASNMRQFREIELAKWTKDVDIVNVTKDRLFKKQQHSDTVDLEIAKLKQNQNQFESTDAYNKARLDLEVIKASTQEEQHELEIDLKYRDTGKVVDVMLSDESGIPKKAEIRSYYSYKDDEFKTEFIGWSPLSSSEFTTLQDEIYDIASTQLEGILDDADYATKYENLVNKLWKEKMIEMYGTQEGAEKALETDLEE